MPRPRCFETRTLAQAGPLLLLLACALASVSRADWGNDPSGGVRAESTLALTPRPFCVPDSGGGFVLLDAANVPHGGFPALAQRLDRWGRIRWGGGLEVANSGGYSWGSQGGPNVAADGSGGLLSAWWAGSLLFSRVTAQGTDPFTASGKPVEKDTDFSSETVSLPHVVSDGAGGAVVAWVGLRSYPDGSTVLAPFAQRVGPDGTPLWSADVPLGNAGSMPVFWLSEVSDGDGGALVFWSAYPPSGGAEVKLFMQHVDGTGSLLMSPVGVRVCTSLGNQNPPVGSDTYHWDGLEAIPDGAGGAIVLWADSRTDTQFDLYTQRVGPTGTRLWNAAGVAVCTQAGKQDVPRLATDGAGGMIAAWQDFADDGAGDVFAQRVDASGTIPSPWPARGVGVGVGAGIAQSQPCISSDGAGGAYIAWVDGRNGGSDVYAQRLSPGGAYEWVAEALPDGIPAHLGASGTPRIVDAGGGHAIVAFTCDFCACPYGYNLRANRIPMDWPASVPGGTPGAFGLRGVRPNPGSGALTVSFSLDPGMPARLEVLDLAGRRVLAREMGAPGAGERAVGLDLPPALAPGLYTLRLIQGGRSATTRLVRLR